MVILFYGPDAYGRLRELENVQAGILKRNPDLVRGSFDLAVEGDIYALYEFTTVSGLFSQGKRVAVVRNAVSFFTDDLFRGIISRAAEDHDVVLLLHESRDKKLERSQESFCKKRGIQICYFPKPTAASSRVRIKKYAESQGVSIDSDAIAFLSDFYGGDGYSIMSDIGKWSAVAKKIDVSFLMRTGEYVSEAGLFDFSKSLLYRSSLQQRTALFEKNLSQGEDLYAVFNIVAKMTTSRDVIDALADADLKVKKGLLDIDQALTAIVLG